MSEEKGITPREAEKERREARLAEALRANLRRRKQAGKGREAPDSAAPESPQSGPPSSSLNRP